MLSNILSKEECARCRICCEFDDDDLWETPLIFDYDIPYVLKVNPGQRFLKNGANTTLKLDRDESGIYKCTMLDRSSGCMLGGNKPFDCRIWPLRVMRKDKRNVITISPVCPIVSSKPLDDVKTAARSVIKIIFKEAQKHPEMIKDYIDGYPIIAEE